MKENKCITVVKEKRSSVYFLLCDFDNHMASYNPD